MNTTRTALHLDARTARRRAVLTASALLALVLAVVPSAANALGATPDPAGTPAVVAPTTADAASVVPAADDAGVAWGVEPGGDEARPNFDYEVDPGDVVEDSLIVRNTGATELSLAVYAADAYTTESGDLDLRLSSEERVGGGAWVAVADDAVELAPGASVEIPFTITVPADATPGDHPSGVITSLAGTSEGETLSVDRRLGLRINLRVSGELVPSVAVSEATTSFSPSWNPFGGGAVTVSYRLENTGNTRVVADDAVALSGVLGLGAATLGAQATPEIVPGSSVVVTRVLEGVSALGWLTGAVTVSPQAVGLGAQPLDAVTLDLSTPAISWTLVALLALVAGAVVLIVVLARRRAKPTEDAPASPGR